MLLLTLSGGQPAAHQLKQTKENAMTVIIEDGNDFPQVLVGTWKAQGKSDWELTFEPDGKISSVVISLGKVKLKPGQVTEIPMKGGGKGIFEPGEFLVHYSSVSKELLVKINLDYFYTQLPGGVLEGKSTDVFVGKIPNKGQLWQVEWTSFPHYIARTKTNPNFKLTKDEYERGLLKTISFEKVINNK